MHPPTHPSISPSNCPHIYSSTRPSAHPLTCPSLRYPPHECSSLPSSYSPTHSSIHSPSNALIHLPSVYPYVLLFLHSFHKHWGSTTCHTVNLDGTEDTAHLQGAVPITHTEKNCWQLWCGGGTWVRLGRRLKLLAPEHRREELLSSLGPGAAPRRPTWCGDQMALPANSG